MSEYKKYIQHFLNQTAHLFMYAMVVVSLLSVLIPYFGFNFDFTTWGNAGGYSILCDFIFIERFYFNKRYCVPTRYLPFGMLFINIVNIISNEFFYNYHVVYSKWYEVIIFSLTLIIALIVMMNKKINK